MSDLPDDLVNDEALLSAIQAGRDAMPEELDGLSDNEARLILERVVGHVREYAEQVPARIAGRLTDVLEKLRDDPDFVTKLDDQLEAFRSAATRYAEPNWGTGQESYGRSLDAESILLDWDVTGDENDCDDCDAIAAAGPYSADDIPSWPGQGDTQCLDRCRCTITADADTWNQAMNGASTE